jgi:catechol 2,3-dioxygenase-like lactoylglutathione lyase family enzyme
MAEHPLGPLSPPAVLETCLYALDLEAAEEFYSAVLGLTLISRQPGRHVFFRCGQGVFLVFNPTATLTAPAGSAAVAFPSHGTRGPGHVAFRMEKAAVDQWKQRLQEHAVPIEAEVEWPRGGRSLYFRDPEGNSVELASPEIWGIA